MSTSSINYLASKELQSILASALPKTGLSANNTGTNLNGIGAPSASQPDHSQLSPVAQLMSTLQHLQQSNPTLYQQVTKQIATNLQSAAQAGGNTTAVNQLNQLSTDFKSASQSGQLPNIQDLAQAIGGGGHHHRHHAASADSNTATGTNSSPTPTLSQLLASLQQAGTQNDALNPLNIIQNTLSSSGITG